jgi:hypothetical protein
MIKFEFGRCIHDLLEDQCAICLGHDVDTDTDDFLSNLNTWGKE